MIFISWVAKQVVGKEQGRDGCESGFDGGACARQSFGGAGRAPRRQHRGSGGLPWEERVPGQVGVVSPPSAFSTEVSRKPTASTQLFDF